MNLSQTQLDHPTYTLLERGLTFVPKPPRINISEIIINQNKLIREIKLKTHRALNQKDNCAKQISDTNLATKKKPKRFIEKSKWEPALNSLPPDIIKCIQDIRDATGEILTRALDTENLKCDNNASITNPLLHAFNLTLRNTDKNNLSREEYASLKSLSKNKNIIIKPADKGGATVILDSDAYEKEAMRQLSNDKYYKEISQNLACKNSENIKGILSRMLLKKKITQAQFNYLSGPEDFSHRTFYLLPKIHKPKTKWPWPNMPEGRPIVSDTNSESARVAEYIDFFLNPLSTNNFSYLKNSYDFIDKIRNKSMPEGYLFVTGDVKSLYTNMNIDRMVQVAKRALDMNPDITRPDQEILELLKYTLLNNDFSFNNQQYLQIHGTAMGKKYAPALANLYLGEFDQLATSHPDFKPEHYFRFLDDVHFIWGGGIDKLMEYQTYLNTLIPDIEITFEFSTTEIPFLDVLLYNENNVIKTRTYFKPTDTHQLLHTTSHHPKHTCRGILKSQFIRFKRLSSTFKDYNNTCNHLYSRLKNRGYTGSEFRKLKFSIWHQDQTKPINCPLEKPLLPIIMNYCNIGQKLSTTYKTLVSNNPFLSSNRLVRAFTIGRNLKQILVRSTFCKDNNLTAIQPTQLTGGFKKCNSNQCNMCRFFSHENQTVQSKQTKKTYNIIGNMTCTNKNVIYLITCKRCQIMYIGETGRPIRDRLNDHISCAKLRKTTAISVHFNSLNHKISDINILPIELIKTNCIETRRKREVAWINKLNTAYPHGLNYLPIND